MSDITEFQGSNRWLSNFWPAQVVLDGITYPSVEHAYVAAKTIVPGARNPIPTMTAGQAKRYGRSITLRKDWDKVKRSTMEGLLRQKFQTGELRDKLLATGDAQLIEGNHWGDTYWGVCKGKGENNLGKLLMKIRAEIKDTTNEH